MAEAMVESQVVEGQPAGESGNDAGIAPEQTGSASASGDSVKDDANWWDTEGIKDVKEAQNRIKEIQRQYNKHAEKNSELSKQVEQLKTVKANYEKAVEETLKNPEKYKEYRKQMGLEAQEVDLSKQPMPAKLETSEDLVNWIGEVNKWWQAKLDYTVQQTKRDFDSRLNTIATPVAEDRWNSARDQMKKEYGDNFAKVEDKVIHNILNGPYRQLYGQPGINEKSLLDKVFKAEFPDEYASHSFEKRRASMEKKKTAATETSRKSVTTTGPASTKEDIIARINARLGG